MEKQFLIWVDDDTNLIEPERFDLELLGVHAQVFDLPSEALDWVAADAERAKRAVAFVIDALLPRCEDDRFRTDTRTAAGIVLCKCLSELSTWPEISRKLRVYTRLPDGPRYHEVKAEADAIGVELHRKSTTSRLALWLRDSGLIAGPDA